MRIITDKALTQFKEAEYFIEKGTIFFLKNEYDAAIKIYKEGLVIYPKGRDLKTWLGWCYEKKGDTKKALEIYGDEAYQHIL